MRDGFAVDKWLLLAVAALLAAEIEQRRERLADLPSGVGCEEHAPPNLIEPARVALRGPHVRPSR